MDEMLASIGGLHFYPLYIYLSQFVHGGHAATWIYRQGLGTHRLSGEFIDSSDWYLALRICWLALSHPGNILLSNLGASIGDTFIPTVLEVEVVAAINATNKVKDEWVKASVEENR